MKTIAFIVEITWLKNVGHGVANGYVAIPPKHPLFGKCYDEVENIDVHGGITFSGSIKEFNILDIRFVQMPTDITEDWWVFGFDTAHFGDNPVNWSKENVIKETLNLQNQLEAL